MKLDMFMIESMKNIGKMWKVDDDPSKSCFCDCGTVFLAEDIALAIPELLRRFPAEKILISRIGQYDVLPADMTKIDEREALLAQCVNEATNLVDKIKSTSLKPTT